MGGMDAPCQPRPPYRVADLAARTGFHRDTVYAWISRGVEVNGRVVKLRAERLGGSLIVRRRDWRAFRAACNPGSGKAPARPRASPSAQKRARAAVAGWQKLTGRKP
jgi:hypothetical protein